MKRLLAFFLSMSIVLTLMAGITFTVSAESAILTAAGISGEGTEA